MGRDDDERCLRHWTREHGAAVSSMLARREYNREDVAELTADVFWLAYRNIEVLKYASDVDVRHWLLRTTYYLLRNHLRRAISRRKLLERLAREPLPLAESPEQAYEHQEAELGVGARDERVRRMLEGMREDYRLVLVMDALGHSDADIARALGVSLNAASKRLMRARTAGRTAFAELIDGGESPDGSDA